MPARKMPDAAEMRRLYWAEGKTPQDIAAMFGASVHTVRSRMKRDGIPMRSKAEGTRTAIERGQRRSRPVVVSKVKERLRCSACGWVWRHESGAAHTVCPHCGADKDARRDRPHDGNLSNLKAWLAANPQKDRRRDQYAALRLSVLLLVGRGSIVCVRCGCDRADLLEINHKNGGGRQEFLREGNAGRFYRDIAQLRRPVDDLELCCRVCNALHALELKHGPLPFRVIYERSGSGGPGESSALGTEVR